VEKKKTHIRGLEQKKLNDDVILDIMDKKIRGYTMNEMFSWFNEQYPKQSKENFKSYYNHAIRRIVHVASELTENVINQHIHLYEKIYGDFREVNNVDGMMRTLNAKEKLMGFHSNVYQFSVNNILGEKEEELRFDFSKLSSKDQKRISELLQKAVV